MTIVKSRIFHVLRRYEFGCDMKPYARIFIVHSVVKIIVKIISISSYKRDEVGILFSFHFYYNQFLPKTH